MIDEPLGETDRLPFGPVPRVDTIGRSEFLARHRRPRRPVVFEALTIDWPARRCWSVEHLARVAGSRRVPVYDGRPARGRVHQHAPSGHMAVADFVDRLRAGACDLRIFFLRVVDELPELAGDFACPDLGLRLVRKLAVLFVGGAGTRVQMHFDIDLADIVLCHFGGRKRVILFPPDQTPYLYRVPFSFSALFDLDPEAPDHDRFPVFRRARGFVAELRHGDALYIPPGWWHSVRYDDAGLSLSLRALPRMPRDLCVALYNVVVLRTVDGLMRRVVGQRWNDRNERVAVARTHARFGRAGAA